MGINKIYKFEKEKYYFLFLFNIYALFFIEKLKEKIEFILINLFKTL